MLRKNDPFIVFSKPLTEKIDRRTRPSELVDGRTVHHMDVFELTMAGSASVAVKGEAPVLYRARQTFYAPKADKASVMKNASAKDAAVRPAFELKNKPGK